ncbi:MAG: DUF4328 domain-containing protein [Flavobacteriaceae bacterium]|jgi:hypothetical protein|nr:DUF4328 domain-containing protein [Flavobacteriaceae bacterium]
MGSLKPNKQRAKNAIILIWIVFALEIASFISNYFEYDLLLKISAENMPDTLDIDVNDSRQSTLALLYSIAFIISAITFIMWFRRAYYNLHQRTRYLSYSEGWAAGSWFVPILNLFRPYQIMRELYVETRKLISKNAASIDFTTSLLWLWWTLWIINNIIGQFIFRYDVESTDEFITFSVANMLDNIVGIILAPITVKVIKDYSNVEPLLMNEN